MYLERSMLDFLHFGFVRIAKRIQAFQLGLSQPGAGGGSKLNPIFERKNRARSW